MLCANPFDDSCSLLGEPPVRLEEDDLDDGSLFLTCVLAAGIGSQVRQAMNWHCSIVGRVPDRAWKNTDGLIFGHTSSPTFWASLQQVPVGELCQDRLLDVISISEQFPPSYNKTLIQGSADYCRRVLERLPEVHEDEKALLASIRKYATQMEALCAQYEEKYSASFSLLNLQVFEDKFDLIQSESARMEVFPALRDVPTRELATL